MSKKQEQETTKTEQKLWVAVAKLGEDDFPEPRIFNPDNFCKWEIKVDSLKPVKDLFPKWFTRKTLKLCEKHLNLHRLRKLNDKEYGKYFQTIGYNGDNLVNEVCDFLNISFFSSLCPLLVEEFKVLCILNPKLQDWTKKWCSDNYAQALVFSLYDYLTKFLGKRNFTLVDYNPGEIYDDCICAPNNICVGMRIRCNRCGNVPIPGMGNNGMIDWDSSYNCHICDKIQNNSVMN